MIGKILGNRYEIVEKIGGGGMSVVYKAKCNVLNRFVAIKVLRHELTSDPDFVEKFKQESLSAASLTHPNIVNIYDTGIEDDIYYIVMEYVKGETLKSYIKRKGRLSEQETINIAKQIAEALKQAHSNKIVHRDIKPHNILLTEEGIVKVADFGIARASTSSTINNASNVIGSVHYFSPEQARGGYVDEKSDIYSLGVVMYEMITGVVPFDADNHISVAMKQIQEKPIPPSKKINNANISEALEDIIMKCLEKYQSYRFQNMEEFLIALNAVDGYVRNEIRYNNNMDSPTIIVPTVENDNGEEERNIIDISLIDEESDNAFRTFFGEYGDEEEVEKGEKGKRIKTKKNKKENYQDLQESKIDEDIEDDENKKNVKMTIIAIVSALLVALLGGIIGFRMFFHNPEISVPDVVGKNEEEAKKIIEDLGLVFEVEKREFDNEFEEGEIIEQKTEEGKKVKKDFVLQVVVSKGAKEITIPQLVGKYSIEAPLILAELGLLPGDDIKEKYHESIPAGQIIDQYPDANTPAETGDKVNYTISLGPEKSYVIMPRLVGSSLEEALIKIKQNGLIYTTEEEYSDEVSKGIVITQNIPYGQEVEVGSSVAIVVSKGEEVKEPEKPEEPEVTEPETPKEKTFPLTISLPSDRETVAIVIQKITAEGREVIYSQEVNTSDQSIIVNVKGTGTQVFEIYADNVLHDRIEITFN